MTMKTKTCLFVFGLLSIARFAQAQCDDYIWPSGAERATAEEKNVLYSDALMAHHYKEAIQPLNWLLTHAPNLHKSLYINGAEIFDNLAEQEKDPVMKQHYVDSLMLMFDMRMQYCGEQNYVVNRKALASFKHYINSSNADKVKETLVLMDTAFSMNGADILDITLVPYMQSVMINELKYHSLTDDQILQRYDKLMEVINKKLESGDPKTKERLKTYKDQIDEILLRVVDVNCEFINNNLKPKFKANPTDILLAQKIFQFMLKANCIDDPFWLEVGEAVYKGGKKDYGLAINMARKYLALETYEKARFWFKEAVDQAANVQDKAESLIYLGQIERNKGNKTGARDYYRQALAADPGNKDALEKIGDLYLYSFDDCKKEESMAQDRLVYIAAYEMFQKAGNSQKMAQAQAQFPSIEEIFTQGWEVGQVKSVGCWIGESVTLKVRPQGQ